MTGMPPGRSALPMAGGALRHPPGDASPPSDSRLANAAARLIWTHFGEFWEEFGAITDRAAERFAIADWSGMAGDTARRLATYGERADAATRGLASTCGDRLSSIPLWTGIKAVFSGLIEDSEQQELAETFFNSITRKVFTTQGVNQQIEFVASDYGGGGRATRPDRVVVHHRVERAFDAELTDRLAAAVPEAPWADLAGDAAIAAKRLGETAGEVTAIELARSVFYRGTGAYVIGRVWTDRGATPVALALLHNDRGVYLDAVLTTESELSILFSFARSYFHVAVEEPAALVGFLGELMPRKRIAELYMSIGFHKHGKTELFRALVEHLDGSSDRFVIAEGAAGMVMTVFTLPGFDVVFKVIKDRFPPQKKVTPSEVQDRYRLVFNHDRVGRLVDAYDFEYLTFPLDRFDPALLQRLEDECSRDVWIGADSVVLRHAYIERRVTPLDVYLAVAESPAATAAVLDYGQAIKDLTAAGIFPGDMLLKNFGVTRHGRVVFYDYDELKLLEGCTFRALPEASHPDDEMSATPWFPVGPNDVFPEEFPAYLGLQGELRQAFLDAHADLFTPQLWQGTQAAVASGLRLPVYPYRRAARVMEPT